MRLRSGREVKPSSHQLIQQKPALEWQAGTNSQEEHRAATRVFGIPELAEMILLHLPMRDLLLAQRVCSHWRTSIEGSPKIQRALFFTPSDKRKACPGISSSGGSACSIRHVVPYTTQEHHYKNPLLLDYTRYQLPFIHRAGSGKRRMFVSFSPITPSSRSPQDSYKAEPRHSPRASRYLPSPSQDQLTVEAKWAIKQSYSSLPQEHPDASWTHMLIKQPPFTSLSIYDSRDVGANAIIEVTNTPITVGVLEEAVRLALVASRSALLKAVADIAANRVPENSRLARLFSSGLGLRAIRDGTMLHISEDPRDNIVWSIGLGWS